MMEEKGIEKGLPDYLSKEDLHEIANEDAWVEFVPVNLGHWGGSDLRTMSDEVGLKEIYDKYYVWPSGYTHGTWAAIRDSVLQMCANPVHRLHKIPRTQIRVNTSAVKDMLTLWEKIFTLIKQATL